jgi:anti-anti-sigma factor
MIALYSAGAASRGFTPAGCVVDCNGAQLRAHRRDQVTIVQVTGDIDATNIDRCYDYVNRFIGDAPGLILDLSGVDFLCAMGISVLIALGDNCRTAGTRWVVVVSPCVRRLLQLGNAGGALATSSSVREAAHDIAAQLKRVHRDPDSVMPDGRIRSAAGFLRRITPSALHRSERASEFTRPPEELAAAL